MLKHAIGAAALVLATHSGAVSLGVVQGRVMIDRPLDVLVKASIDSAEVLTGLCLEADLLYGDNRVPASAVTVTIHKQGSDGTGTLRVRSSRPVNEPVVTLLLKAGCSSRYARSYALLADFEPPPAASARERPTPRVQDLVPARPAASAPAAAVAVRKTVKTDVKAVAERESPIRLQPPQQRPVGVMRALAKSRPGPAPVASQVQAPAPAVVSRPGPAEPRLKLDLVDLGPASKAAGTAAPAPAAATAGAASEPSAAKSPVVPASPTQPPAPDPVADHGDAAAATAPEAQRMHEMVRELEGMRVEQARMRAAVEAVNAQLTQSRNQRFLDPLVLGLLGLSAAALAALAWLWNKSRRQRAPGVADADASAAEHNPAAAARK